MFDNEILVKRANGKEVLIWNKERDMSIITKMMSSHDVRVTRKLVEQKGALYDATVYKAGVAKPESYVAMQPNDSKLGDVTKYGGYTKIKNAYFVIYSGMNNKGSRDVYMMPIPLNVSNRLNDDVSIQKYVTVNTDKLSDIKILCKKICINSLVKIDGFYYYVGGKTNDRFCIDAAIQVVLSDKSTKYIKSVEKFVQLQSENGNLAPNDQIISYDKNLEIFIELINKFNSNIYKHMRGNKYEDLRATGLDNFKKLDLTEQCKQVMQVLNFLTQLKSTFDLKPLGIKASRATQGFKLSSVDEFVVINESVTGLFKNEIPIIGG